MGSDVAGDIQRSVRCPGRTVHDRAMWIVGGCRSPVSAFAATPSQVRSIEQGVRYGNCIAPKLRKL